MAKTTDFIKSYYGRLVGLYGRDARSCDFGSMATQENKFGVLSRCLDYSGKSVLDIGCGYAAFADYLAERFPGVRYTGVDLCPEMVALARSERLEDFRVVLGDFQDLELPPADIVTANGIFYLLGDDAQALMRGIIERMWALAGEAVAFNSLSSWREDQEPGEFYADPLETVRFCKRFTPWVSLRHDYHPGDFTVCMYRERQGV